MTLTHVRHPRESGAQGCLPTKARGYPLKVRLKEERSDELVAHEGNTRKTNVLPLPRYQMQNNQAPHLNPGEQFFLAQTAF